MGRCAANDGSQSSNLWSRDKVQFPTAVFGQKVAIKCFNLILKNMISSNCTEWFGKPLHHTKAIRTKTTEFTPLQHDPVA